MTPSQAGRLTDAEIAELLSDRELQKQLRRGGLRHLTPENLAEPPGKPDGLIQGLLTTATFGPFAGKKKSLKSWTAHGCAIAVASGKPAFSFERWKVPEARPALICVGEGGESSLMRRHQRMAKEIYGIDDVRELPLHCLWGAANMTGDEFRNAFVDAVLAMERRYGQPPGYIVLDSLYNYHPEDLDAANLYVRGPMLREFQETVFKICGPDTTLSVVDHVNKGSTGVDLDAIAYSGMSQWADSWIIMEKRAAADVTNRIYLLNIEVGSRDGYNGMYEMDIDLGPYDEDKMEDERPMKIAVRRVSEFQRQKDPAKLSNDALDAAIVELVGGDANYTRADVEKLIEGAGAVRVRARVKELITGKLLTEERGLHQEGARMVERDIVKPQDKIRRPATPSSNPV